MRFVTRDLKVEIGAWSQEGGAWQTPREYFEMASNSSTRETFARSVATFVTENNFDGFHLHWGNPESSGIDLDQAKTHLTQLLRELATTLHLVNKTLSVAVWSPLPPRLTKSLRLRIFTKKPTSCSSMISTFHFLNFDITYQLKVLNSEIHIPMISSLLTTSKAG